MLSPRLELFPDEKCRRRRYHIRRQGSIPLDAGRTRAPFSPAAQGWYDTGNSPRHRIFFLVDPMRLKTKLVLAISGMVVALVAIFSYFYVSRLVRQRIYEAYDSADFVAKEIRESARAASLANLGSTFADRERSAPGGSRAGAGAQAQ